MKNTRNIRRQQITEKLAEISPWDLSGSAEKIYKELKDTENAYLINGYNKSSIIDYCWAWESDVYDSSEGCFVLTITRLENDKEYNARVKKLMKIKEGEKAAKEQEKFEYEEYLRLKQKFDKDWKNDWSQP